MTYFAERRVNGKTRRVTIGRHGVFTCEQARKEALRLLGQMASGHDPNADKLAARAHGVTLREAFDEFLKVRTHTEKTAYTYRRLMEVVFLDWQSKPLTAITKDMVTKRHADRTKDRGPAYADLAMRLLRSIWNFAAARFEDTEGNSLLPENPVNRLSRLKAWNRVRPRQTVIKRHQLPAWYASVMSLRAGRPTDKAEVVRDYLLLLLFTGLRRQEAARLRWQDVDFEDRTLTVPVTKNDTPLTLPLSSFVHDLLARRKARATSEHVFPGNGAAGHLVEPRKQMAKVRAESGVEFTLHDLRRSFITLAEGLDVSAYALKRLVNHKMSGDVTAGYIVHDVERLRGPMQKVTDHLLSLCADTTK
jgi:integrase